MAELSANDIAQIKQVLQAFLDAGARRDEEAMRACLTRATLEAGGLDASPAGLDFVMDEPRLENGRAIVPLRGYPSGAPEGTPPAMEFPCLMEREDGQWKFDLAGTGERMAAGLGGAMERVAEAMTESWDGLGQALGAGLRQVFGEGTPESWDNAPPTPEPAERLPLPELRTLPKTQAALSEAVGSPVLMQAAMSELLQRAGSDEDDVLFDWFEDQLFAGWAAMLAEAAARVPLQGRLRAVRIESVAMAQNRLLAIDGSDLVYRMLLPYNEGFFRDEEVAAMLPGVLAGLPEAIDPAVAGYRLLPGEDENPDVEAYRRRVAPRLMRRIGAIVGRHVALEADWGELADSHQAGSALGLWGLNRILGGIALACLEPARREELAGEGGLERIRIVYNYEITRRYARYEGGTLEVGLNFFGGENTGPYEHEVAQALAGEAVE